MMPFLIGLCIFVSVMIVKTLVNGGRSEEDEHFSDNSRTPADGEKDFYQMMEATRKREEEKQRQQRSIIIKNSKVYLVKGGSDEWE